MSDHPLYKELLGLLVLCGDIHQKLGPNSIITRVTEGRGLSSNMSIHEYYLLTLVFFI